jgi:hypothetical protein
MESRGSANSDVQTAWGIGTLGRGADNAHV